MILTDGRGVVHDIGPSHATPASHIEFKVADAGARLAMSEGGWRRTNDMLFAGPVKPKKVAQVRVRRPRALVRALARPPRINAKAPRPERDTCRPGRHPRPPAGTRCPACKAEAFARWKAKSGAAPSLARCVYDGVMFKAAQPKRALYCSTRCRGRYEREQKLSIDTECACRGVGCDLCSLGSDDPGD